jgi:hypothetical protein
MCVFVSVGGCPLSLVWMIGSGRDIVVVRMRAPVWREWNRGDKECVVALGFSYKVAVLFGGFMDSMDEAICQWGLAKSSLSAQGWSFARCHRPVLAEVTYVGYTRYAV